LEESNEQDAKTAEKEDQNGEDIEDEVKQDVGNVEVITRGRCEEDGDVGDVGDGSFDDTFVGEKGSKLSVRSTMSHDYWDHREEDSLYDEDATFHKRHFSSDSPFYDYDHANEFFMGEEVRRACTIAPHIEAF
jgi:hypothetical protein